MTNLQICQLMSLPPKASALYSSTLNPHCFSFWIHPTFHQKFSWIDTEGIDALKYLVSWHGLCGFLNTERRVDLDSAQWRATENWAPSRSRFLFFSKYETTPTCTKDEITGRDRCDTDYWLGRECAWTYYIGSFFIRRSAVEILLYLHLLEVFEEVGSDMLQSVAKEHVNDDKWKGMNSDAT